MKTSGGDSVFYVDTDGDVAQFVKAKTPYDAFLVTRNAYRGLEHKLGRVTVYRASFFNDVLIGHGDPLWTEHPEGDPGRADLDEGGEDAVS